MTSFKKVAFILGLIIMSGAESFAQAPPPAGGSTVGAPIDDYAWVLALILSLFGVWSITLKMGLKPQMISLLSKGDKVSK